MPRPVLQSGMFLHRNDPPSAMELIKSKSTQPRFDRRRDTPGTLKNFLPERSSQRRIPGRISEFDVMHRRYRGPEITPLGHPPCSLSGVVGLRSGKYSRGRRHPRRSRSVVPFAVAPLDGRESTNTNDGRTFSLPAVKYEHLGLQLQVHFGLLLHLEMFVNNEHWNISY